MPVIIGLDVAGEIVEVGPGVTDWAPGDRVLVDPINRVEGGLMGETVNGGLAELCKARAHQLVRIPDGVTYEQAAALPMRIRQKLAAMIAKHATDRPQMRFNGFDAAMAEEMRAMYRDGNDAFAQRHFGASWDELFPPKPIQYVSRDALDELDAPDRREISIIAGQVMIEALESGLLHLSANPPADT